MGARDFWVRLGDQSGFHMEKDVRLMPGGVASVKNSRRLDKSPR